MHYILYRQLISKFKHTFRIMKITVVALFAFVFALLATQASSQNVKVSIRANQLSTKEVIAEIEKQTEYLFVYNKNEINVDRLVSLDVSNKPVSDVLLQLFDQTAVKYKLVGKNISLIKRSAETKVALQKVKVITGVVVDQAGEPIIGANVVEKGTTNGTMTDIDGHFSLETHDKSILLVTFIGYASKEIVVGNKSSFNIELAEDLEQLEEVVVIGYGTQKKSSVTGSIAAIKGSEISKVAASNVGSTLAGRLPGLIAYNRGGEPGSDNATLNIRGFGSPLVIVDGVEIRDFQKMDPNDIESFSVLKDASASIYGARAGNGVILIKTKRGTSGKPELSFNTTLSWQSAIKTVNFVEASDFVMLWNEAADNSGMPERKYADEQVEKYRREGGTDWYAETFREQAPMQQYNLSIRGGNEKVKYYVAAGYLHQTGLLRSNDQQIRRYNVRSNVDIHLLDNLSISLDLAGTWNNTDVPALSMWDTYANIFIARPTDPAYWPNHSYAPKSTYHGEWASTAFSTRKDFRGYRRKDDYSILPAVTINYDFKFAKGLSARAFLNYRIDNIYEKQFDKSFAIYDYNYDTDVYTKQREYPAALREQYWNVKKTSPQVSLNYHNVFKHDHNLSALALFEYNVYYDNNFQAERRGFLSNEVEQLPAGDPTSQKNNGGAFEEGRISWIGRANYAYKQKYLAEVLVRLDGSAKFANSGRWGAFPGVSLGWRMSEEAFMKLLGNLDNLKVRASYGMAGNDNNGEINKYQYLNGYSKNGNYVFGANQNVVDGLATRGLNNPDITWEKTATYNVGVDFSFWRRKLYGEVDAFYREVWDVFGSKVESLPNSFGASLPQMNINSYNDRGFEILLGHMGNASKVIYTVEGNVSWTRSKWDHYDEPVYADKTDRYRLQQSGEWRNRWFGYKSQGLFRSQQEIDDWSVDQDGQGNRTISPGDIRFKDIDGDNNLTDRDRVNIGRSDVPEIVFGLKATADWNGFDFNMLWQGTGRVNTMYNGDLRRPFFDTATPHEGFLNRFHPENNPDGTWPRMTFDNSSNNDKESDFWLQNASYIRLKNIELGYTVPKVLLLKTKLSGVRFFIAGMNLLTIDNVDTIDPEVGKGDRGWRYPVQKTISFGFNLNL